MGKKMNASGKLSHCTRAKAQQTGPYKPKEKKVKSV